MARFAPMPSARVSTAIKLNVLCLMRSRIAYRISARSVSIPLLEQLGRLRNLLRRTECRVRQCAVAKSRVHERTLTTRTLLPVVADAGGLRFFDRDHHRGYH